MLRFRHVEDTFRKCCQSWGYEEVRTPTLEYLHLFTATGTLTPGRLGQVYSFLDWDGWSGERVVLRPEGTIPAVRLYLDGLRSDVLEKLFYVENIFRFEESGTQQRERWQCGVELLGSAQPAADAELLLLARDVLRRLGLESTELRVSHVGLLRALLRESGLDEDTQHEALDRVLDGDVQLLHRALEANSKTKDAVPLLLELQGKSPGFLKNLKTSLSATLPTLAPHLADFIAVAELLGPMEGDYHIDLTSSLGFEYYTGITFQFYLNGKRLGAGGRYNDLVPLLGGGKAPASGFAFDMDQLINLVAAPADAAAPYVTVRPGATGIAAWHAAVEAAAKLRQKGIVADLDVGNGRRREAPWMLEVQGDGDNAFVLTRGADSSRTAAASLDKIITRLWAK